jgi:hypothetical protein
MSEQQHHKDQQTTTTTETPSSKHPTITKDSPDVQGEQKPKEIGGRKGLDPTRYGDWEKAGRCIDF